MTAQKKSPELVVRVRRGGSPRTHLEHRCRTLRVFAAAAGVSSHCKSRRLQRVLADFGAEHSFAGSCKRVQEHYGFEINASAVRQETLRHAEGAAAMLDEECAQSFRVLPKEGAEHVIAEADGTMICTVERAPARRPIHGIGRRCAWWPRRRPAGSR